MRTAIEAINTLTDFITENVATKIKLQREFTEENREISFVNPIVIPGFMPHTNFLPYAFQTPYILVSVDEGIDDTSDSSVAVRIVFGVFGGGFYKDEFGIDTSLPDMQGYKDLLNIIEKTRNCLTQNQVLNNGVSIRYPLKYGIYETDIYPYFYGYIKFEVAMLQPEFNLNIL